MRSGRIGFAGRSCGCEGVRRYAIDSRRVSSGEGAKVADVDPAKELLSTLLLRNLMRELYLVGTCIELLDSTMLKFTLQ